MLGIICLCVGHVFFHNLSQEVYHIISYEEARRDTDLESQYLGASGRELMSSRSSSVEQRVRGQPSFCATLSQDTKQYKNKLCVWNMAALFQGFVS